MKLSELIVEALKDVAKCEADPLYEINMNFWQKKCYITDICYVCLAGAVMAKKYGAPRQTMTPSELASHLDNEEIKKLAALDDIRLYEIKGALIEFYDDVGITRAREVQHIVLRGIDEVEYNEKPNTFKINMCLIAQRLEQEGF